MHDIFTYKAGSFLGRMLHIPAPWSIWGMQSPKPLEKWAQQEVWSLKGRDVPRKIASALFILPYFRVFVSCIYIYICLYCLLQCSQVCVNVWYCCRIFDDLWCLCPPEDQVGLSNRRPVAESEAELVCPGGTCGTSCNVRERRRAHYLQEGYGARGLPQSSRVELLTNAKMPRMVDSCATGSTPLFYEVKKTVKHSLIFKYHRGTIISPCLVVQLHKFQYETI